MQAVVYEEFGGPLEVREVPDPTAPPGGVVIRVEATGLCRSDRHGWEGHDPDIQKFPHVPGHELAGTVAEVGAGVRYWKPGDRVAVPFISACGHCASCLMGEQQVCENQTQPGFTHWGSFADLVMIEQADLNLLELPAGMSFATAAALGCRFATSFRAVLARGRVSAGEWVAVHGCGGVGLAAVMIAVAAGARVVAVDISAAALELARGLGATALIDASGQADVAARVREITGGGAHVSMDALGNAAVARASILGLRRQGRHLQVGVLPAAAGPADLPMHLVMSYELEIIGSHGMAAHGYRPMMEMVQAGTLRPERLISRTIGLAEVPAALVAMDTAGVTMVVPG